MGGFFFRILATLVALLNAWRLPDLPRSRLGNHILETLPVVKGSCADGPDPFGCMNPFIVDPKKTPICLNTHHNLSPKNNCLSLNCFPRWSTYPDIFSHSYMYPSIAGVIDKLHTCSSVSQVVACLDIIPLHFSHIFPYPIVLKALSQCSIKLGRDAMIPSNSYKTGTKMKTIITKEGIRTYESSFVHSSHLGLRQNRVLRKTVLHLNKYLSLPVFATPTSIYGVKSSRVSENISTRQIKQHSPFYESGASIFSLTNSGYTGETDWKYEKNGKLVIPTNDYLALLKCVSKLKRLVPELSRKTFGLLVQHQYKFLGLFTADEIAIFLSIMGDIGYRRAHVIKAALSRLADVPVEIHERVLYALARLAYRPPQYLLKVRKTIQNSDTKSPRTVLSIVKSCCQLNCFDRSFFQFTTDRLRTEDLSKKEVVTLCHSLTPNPIPGVVAFLDRLKHRILSLSQNELLSIHDIGRILRCYAVSQCYDTSLFTVLLAQVDDAMKKGDRCVQDGNDCTMRAYSKIYIAYLGYLLESKAEEIDSGDEIQQTKNLLFLLSKKNVKKLKESFTRHRGQIHRSSSALHQDLRALIEKILPDGYDVKFEYESNEGLVIDTAILRQGKTPVAIEVNGPFHYVKQLDDNTQNVESGPTKYKARLLAKAGWRLISIPYFAVPVEQSARTNYLRILLVHELLLESTSIN